MLKTCEHILSIDFCECCAETRFLLVFLSSSHDGTAESNVFAMGMVVSGTIWIELAFLQFFRTWNHENSTWITAVLDVIFIITAIVSGLSLAFIGTLLCDVFFILNLKGLVNYEGATIEHIGVTNGFIVFGILMMFVQSILTSLLSSDAFLIAWRFVSASLSLVSSYCCKIFCHLLVDSASLIIAQSVLCTVWLTLESLIQTKSISSSKKSTQTMREFLWKCNTFQTLLRYRLSSNTLELSVYHHSFSLTTGTLSQCRTTN